MNFKGEVPETVSQHVIWNLIVIQIKGEVQVHWRTCIAVVIDTVVDSKRYKMISILISSERFPCLLYDGIFTGTGCGSNIEAKYFKWSDVPGDVQLQHRSISYQTVALCRIT